ncbi:MAG: class I SAM-dependent methyltransferase [Euryarchaeota archaeon]|nr:class I SAM-dependent methyltransferase [Euryarchaeota archaeon]MDE1835785.1 class I SAM-dependent methyltransferase [Euryarchaeota archaeon]MDE1880741.1 class I SAM-dependent methyltransferase [Euryarchaeota archaeon]MDE2043976.1 class I SAM-dependent methyltransferase [Thermoplasmata archaeon]
MATALPKRLGRRIFGTDPAVYNRVRFGYPPRVHEILQRRCGLVPGSRVFEIGPGTGIATRELLMLGANPLTVVEPDPRLARYLGGHLCRFRSRVRIVNAPFERAQLEEGGYDLGAAATSFHWLNERVALRKVARALRPEGWWASWSNLHGDLEHPGPFHRAIQPLYGRPSGQPPKWAQGGASLAKQQAERLHAIRASRCFDRATAEVVRWPVTLSTSRVVALWSTFSDIRVLPVAKRRQFLLGLARISDDEFGGTVRFKIVTPIVTARRV